MKRAAILISLFAGAACQSGAAATGTSSAGQQTLGTGVATTSGAGSIGTGGSSSGASTSSGGSSIGTATGTSSGPTTGTGSTTGSATNSVPCAPASVWVGDVCAAADCTRRPNLTVCFAPDGGFGQCGEGACRTSPWSDPLNCGFVGRICPTDAQCTDGSCLSNGGPAFCVDAGCPTASSCLFGGCVPDSCTGQPEGLHCATEGHLCCGGACVDTTFDPQNCGACGNACGAGEVCTLQGCALSSTCGSDNNGATCATDGGETGTCCDAVCVDVFSDSKNCFGCGLPCPEGASCTAQGCAIDGGFVPCSASTCPPGSTCHGVQCINDCGPLSDGVGCWSSGLGGSAGPGLCCGGTCEVDDPLNCGGCGLACPANSICQSGACAPTVTCSTGGLDLSLPCALDDAGELGTCCAGTCVDLQADDDNCDGCGAVCVGGAHCRTGQCQGDAGNALGCQSSAECASGTECAFPPGCSPPGCQSLGACLPIICGAAGTASGYGCAAYTGVISQGVCCGSNCALVAGDDFNCGACGQACPLGSACRDYSCVHADGTHASCSTDGCPSGTTCGAEFCVADACTTQANGVGCKGGRCCSGECTDSFSDPENCGDCGFSCDGGLCLNGSCYQPTPPCLVTCADPDTLCDGIRCLASTCGSPSGGCRAENGLLGVCCGDGACAHPLDDWLNCGRCGNACPSNTICASGVCR